MATSIKYAPQAIIADNAKALGSHVAVIPAGGTAQTVNPADNMNSVSIINMSQTNWVRAKVTFVTGVTGDATASQQVQLVPPGGSSIDFDLGNTGGAIGNVDPIDSIVLDTITLPTSGVTEVGSLTAKSSAADAVVVLNFAAN